MKIDLVSPRFFPVGGGIEESVGQLARRLRSRGHDVIVHTTQLPGLAPTDEWENIAVRRYEPDFSLGYYASRFRPRLEGDVVHLHAYGHLTNHWVVRHRPKGTRLFLSTHHGARFPKTPASAIYHAAYNRLQGWRDLRQLDGILVPTKYDLDYFASHVPNGRLHEVPSGVDDAAFQTHPPWTPPSLRGGPFALFLGRLHHEKGVFDLLEAKKEARFRMDVVFAGRDEGALARLEQGKTAGIAIVLDPTPQQRWGLLAACSLLALPSHHEGQGIVLAEAWAQRKPVVACLSGAVPSVVDDGVDGLLVPPHLPAALGAAIHRLEEDPALARAMGERGRQKAEQKYRWDPIVDRIVKLYESARTSAGT